MILLLVHYATSCIEMTPCIIFYILCHISNMKDNGIVNICISAGVLCVLFSGKTPMPQVLLCTQGGTLKIFAKWEA